MMKKMSIIRAAALICMAVFLLLASGCPNAAKKENHTPNQPPKPEPPPEIGEKIPDGAIILSIETAAIGEKGNIKNYAELKNFNKKFSGPYEMTAETAYIALKVKAGEKPGGKDFSITVENMDTYEKKVTLKRGKGADDEYFILSEKYSKLPLSKGKNTFTITVTPPDGSEAGKYLVAVDYAGVPDKYKGKIIPGIYCPAQRKPSEGEKEDFVWAILASGGWPYCVHPLGAAGKKAGIAEKYKEKGLRVIVLGSRADKALLAKLKTFNLDCPLYSVDDNVFTKFFNLNAGIPQDSCIVQGKRKAGNSGAIGEASAYEPYIKKAFGF